MAHPSLFGILCPCPIDGRGSQTERIDQMNGKGVDGAALVEDSRALVAAGAGK